MRRSTPRPLTPEKLIARLLKRRAAIKRQQLKLLAKRRSEKPKPRKPLAKMTKEKAAWTRKYHKALKEAKQFQIDEVGHMYCQRCGIQCEPEGHHPEGRIGDKILTFFLVCAECHHEHIHQTPNKAREEGWLK